MTRVDDNVGGSCLKVWPVGLAKREVGGADETQLVAEGEGRSGEHGRNSIKYGRKMVESWIWGFLTGKIDELSMNEVAIDEERSIVDENWSNPRFFDEICSNPRFFDEICSISSIFPMKCWIQRSFLKRGCRPNASSFKWNLALLGTFD